MPEQANHRAQWNLIDMAAHLPAEAVQSVEPAGDETLLSPDRIKQLAAHKRACHLSENEGKPMKKTLFRTLLIAAVISVMSLTVFAAAGGLDFFIGIFGDSARSIENAVVTPYVTGSAGGREMAVEAVVTDGYVASMVVSLTGTRPDNHGLFHVTGGADISTVSYTPIEELSTADKTYYNVSFTARQRFEGAEVTVSLSENVVPIALTFPLDNRLGNAVVSFPEGAAAGAVYLSELQISPMGFLLVGAEDAAEGGLPATAITVVFKDGTTELLEAEFDNGDETIVGGGGAIIAGPGQKAPLVVTFHGERNPDGEVVVAGQFSRIISPSDIERVIIAGQEYPVN